MARAGRQSNLQKYLIEGMPELKEPDTALAAAVELRVLAHQVEALAVQRARAGGWDWE